MIVDEQRASSWASLRRLLGVFNSVKVKGGNDRLRLWTA